MSTNTTPPPDQSLSPFESALARSRTYVLLSRLLVEGLTADLLPTLRGIADLAVLLPDRFEADEAAAAHHALFGRNVLPYESVFLDPSAMLGGETSAAVQEQYQRIGYAPFHVDAPDHLGEELSVLAFLCGAEADAWRDRNQVEALRMRAVQGDFLRRHPLRWIVPFVLAVQWQGHLFYAEIATLTLDLLDAHARVVDLDAISTPFALPLNPLTLEDATTGLEEIASVWTKPALCGIYLSQTTLEQIARRGRLPLGFAGRTQRLTTLLRSAAQYDQLDDLLSALRGFVEDWRADLVSAQERWTHLAPYVGPWLARVSQTARTIEQMAQMTSRYIHEQ